MTKLHIQPEAERTPVGMDQVYDRVVYTPASKIYYSAALGYVQEQFHSNGLGGLKVQRQFDTSKNLFTERDGFSAHLPVLAVAATVTENSVLGTATGFMRNGKREGVWIERSSYGETHTPYVNGVRHGKQRAFYNDGGQLRREETFVNGLSQGQVVGYFRDGSKEYTADMKDGRVHGWRRGWHDNGRKSFEGEYANGEHNGIWKSWNYYGVLITDAQYKNGKEIGISKHYNGGCDPRRQSLQCAFDHGPDGGQSIKIFPKPVVKSKGKTEPRRGDKDFFRQLRRMFEFGRMARELLHSGRDKAAVTQAPARKAETQTPDGP